MPALCQEDLARINTWGWSIEVIVGIRQLLPPEGLGDRISVMLVVEKVRGDHAGRAGFCGRRKPTWSSGLQLSRIKISISKAVAPASNIIEGSGSTFPFRKRYTFERRLGGAVSRRFPIERAKRPDGNLEA